MSEDVLLQYEEIINSIPTIWLILPSLVMFLLLFMYRK